jgi:glycyl-tRNA synthetase
MKSLFDVNGLMFWDANEIRTRNHMIETFAARVEQILTRENPAWRFVQVDAPLLTPDHFLNPNYGNEDVFRQSFNDMEAVYTGWLTLRPETTPGSYRYAEYLFDTHDGYKAPLVVWQAGKSFRREQDQVSKNMRLKEFYQMEFQCIYAADSMNDYHAAVLQPVCNMLQGAIGLDTRLVKSDRLPDYSEITMDVEVQLDGAFPDARWMEVCSISRRTDFPVLLRFPAKKGLVEKEALVLEIAIGLDRCVYAHSQRLGEIGNAV